MVAAQAPEKVFQSTINGRAFGQCLEFKKQHEKDVTEENLAILLSSPILGLSFATNLKSGALVALAIANDTTIRVIELYSNRNKNGAADKKRSEALKNFLVRDIGRFVAFGADNIATGLVDAGFAIQNAFDLNSGFAFKGNLVQIVQQIAEDVASNETGVNSFPSQIENAFRSTIYDEANDSRAVMAGQRAWLAYFVASFGNGPELVDKIKPINTDALNPKLLAAFKKLNIDQRRSNDAQPLETAHKFEQKFGGADQGFRVESTQYKTKFRGNELVDVVIRNEDGSTYTERCQITRLEGREVYLNTKGTYVHNKQIVRIDSLGTDAPTRADQQRSLAVRKTLQDGGVNIQQNPWVRNFYLVEEESEIAWPKEWKLKKSDLGPKVQVVEPPSTLNRSQKGAVRAMLSQDPSDSIIIIEGPPGSGKTSVIGSYVLSAVNAGRIGIWLVAQSNVAVKNIAEKLLRLDFHAWRLLVSKDFHLGWHEHLYEHIPAINLIRSESFMTVSPSSMQNIPVFLCTLSMLSSSLLFKFTRVNPLRTLVIDEASQIEMGSYLPVLLAGQKSLRKMCFIGDDHQLPPYGTDENEDLKSIFEVDHFSEALMLDTQYRMPPQVGNVISKLVYNSELKSFNGHPIKQETPACFFYHANGYEKTSGSSFINEAECAAVLKLAAYLAEAGLEYKIITPYDGQRNFIEQQMKEEEMEWGNKCFNVDSFQGNEEDYIIISLVRSHKVGFLASERRTNVMLTRFKKGMFIVSNKDFLKKQGASTLVTRMLNELQKKVRVVSEGDLQVGKVFLPF